jgi:hypothetical protein
LIAWVVGLATQMVAVSPALALYSTTSFTATYTAYNPSGNRAWAFKMKIRTPTAAGSYPIAIVLGGAGTCQDPPTCSAGCRSPAFGRALV